MVVLNFARIEPSIYVVHSYLFYFCRPFLRVYVFLFLSSLEWTVLVLGQPHSMTIVEVLFRLFYLLLIEPSLIVLVAEVVVTIVSWNRNRMCLMLVLNFAVLGMVILVVDWMMMMAMVCFHLD